jgi:hypothetical protein
MTTNMRAFRGTVVGLLWAFLATPLALPFSPYCREVERVIQGFALVLAMSPILALLFGPGAYLLSLIHAACMEGWASRSRATRQIRIVGLLLGMPLGVANLLLTLIILAHFKGSLDELTLTWEVLVLIIPSLAGGAGIGWGVTSELLPQRPQPRPLPRPRPAIRRNGPPFFDERSRRVS